MPQNEVAILEPEVELIENNLVIQYEAVNSNAIYDLCSLEGRILITGKIGLEKEISLDLSNYPRGSYNLFILDGDQVFKNTMRL